MAFMAVLESDLRALSAEARRRYPAVKDAAEHAILKLRSLSSPSEIAQNEDILRMFLMACDVKSVKLSVLALSCLQKLISHDAVSASSLKEILCTLKDHAEMTDETVQLKTLQTILIILQSKLHPESEDNMAQALGICLRLLESARSSDNVRNTAAATFRQAVALIFDNVVSAESLPAIKICPSSQISRTSFVTDDVSRRITHSMSLESEFVSGQSAVQGTLTKTGKLGLRLLEDLTALAAGGSAFWLRVTAVQRTFALDILEFILSNYTPIFCALVSYEQVLRHQVCSLLLTSLRTNVEVEGEAGEPTFRRLVLRSVAHIIRLYSLFLVTECEVFLNILIKVTYLDLPLWHRILVLEVLRGFCVEARTLRLLFQNFDMDPNNTNVVENMVKALARIISTIQVPETSEESLAAVAGMFSSKAKGIEWSMDNDASNSAVVIASEAHTITLAVEGLLGVVFTISTLTDEAIDVGEVESPKSDDDLPDECSGRTAILCLSMINSTWLTILNSLSLILTRSQGEAVVLEILKGYQAFTQACGVLRAIEPLNSFLASLCKFTINIPNDLDKRSGLFSPGSKRSEHSTDQRENIVLTPKNVQALRTLFNVAHRLHNVLGPSWVLVLETLAALDRAIHSPHASTQEVSTVSRLTRDTSGQYSDFNILSSLNSQLFESSALMHVSAVKSLLSALRQLSSQSVPGSLTVTGQATNQQTGSVAFSIERMTSILVNNLHRVEPIWDLVVGNLLELADSFSPQLRNLALDALDKSICAILGSDQFQANQNSEKQLINSDVQLNDIVLGSFECAILSPLMILYKSSQNIDVRTGSLKILLHVLERHGEKLCDSWPSILDLLRNVASEADKDLVSLGFQSIRVIMNDGLSTVPAQCLDVCIEVTGAYGSQKTDINISLTAIGLLWTATDFIAKGLGQKTAKESSKETETGVGDTFKHALPESNLGDAMEDEHSTLATNGIHEVFCSTSFDSNKLLFSVFSFLQKLGADERPEVRNSAIRTLFQTLGSHGQKLSKSMWEDCLWGYVFPILDRVTHLAATSSKDEWQGKELGTRGGKAVHMLIHHSRNTAQKQWDETLVLVLSGIARLLRSFFPFLQSLKRFTEGWEFLLSFIKDSILNGSKEVAVAGISCLQTTACSHCPKGNMPITYFKSMLDVYELVLQRSTNGSKSANKVKQETLQALGDLYVQAKMMFDSDMYAQLLAILRQTIRNSSSTVDCENDYGSVPPLQRSVLEILPLLHPAENLQSMWPLFLRELVHYLLGCQTLSHEDKIDVDVTDHTKHVLEGAEIRSQGTAGGSSAENTASISSPLIREKLVPVIVELFLEAPPVEKYNAIPEIIQGLGRCMTTRRDNPKGALWRLAVEGFNKLLLEDVKTIHPVYKMDQTTYRLPRARFWKEVADVYETFLVGSCGRAFSSDTPAADVLKADEFIEINFLNVLGDKVLMAHMDAPTDILQRLVSTLDRCASRTGCLPIESVGLIPPNCSKFSLSCLRMMFSLCSYSSEDNWHSKRSEVSKVSILVLMKRCECILNQFLTDENDLGETPLPGVRIEETICVLQELARLIIHPDTASALQLKPSLRGALVDNEKPGGRAHLFVLLPSFCELVVTRETRVRELVQVLLRLISTELGLQKS